MLEDTCRELELDYRDSAGPFPKLGYRVEGLPEADSVLAGLVSQALNPVWRATMPRLHKESILTEAMIAEAKKVCNSHRGSEDASRLETYIARMKRMEKNLRKLVPDVVKPQGGGGPGEPTGINLNQL